MDPSTNDDTLTLPPQPIAEDAVEIRVDVSYHWPEELEGADDATAWGIRQAHEAAKDLFASYRATRSQYEGDKRLTPQGALEATAGWVEENLPRLNKHAESLSRTAKGLDDQLQRMLGEVAKRPEDPIEFEELKEIREWLRTLPERDRTDKIDFLVRHGDTKALRAVLTAPAYLTGVDETMLAFIREDVARKADPDKFTKIEIRKKAAATALKALEGVQRFLAQDTGPNAHLHRTPRPGLRRVG